LIIHGFFSPVHSAAALRLAVGFTAFARAPVAVLSFPVSLMPSQLPALIRAICLSTPAVLTYAKTHSAHSALHFTKQCHNPKAPALAELRKLWSNSFACW